jgi:hypothetical protein
MKSRKSKKIPFDFVLNELFELTPITRPMFGCTAVYVGQKIVLILREKSDHPRDNGVWLATTLEHHLDLKKDFPSMRSIEVFGEGPTGWQNLPSDSPSFEEDVIRACEFIKSKDPRIGKIPKKKKLKTK